MAPFERVGGTGNRSEKLEWLKGGSSLAKHGGGYDRRAQKQSGLPSGTRSHQQTHTSEALALHLVCGISGNRVQQEDLGDGIQIPQ
jgi:hypothetical protein